MNDVASQSGGSEVLFQRFGRQAPAGTVLFREGDSGEEMYVIQSGRVQITVTVRGIERMLDELGPGEFFGEMAILNARPRSATATVIEEAQLLVVGAKTLEAMIRGNTEIAVRMVKKLAERLDEADRVIENLMLRDLASRVVHHLQGLAETAGVAATEGGVRIQTTPSEVSQAILVPLETVGDVFARLVKANLLKPEAGGAFVIPDPAAMGQFLEFLGMKARFERPLT
ncbi:MAG: Crp/Fnr family transcriptional regulator [Deltaproteobacteria bacterium]|nr:Crp/Fnr family transcriptional regulator [Deltaproteobacteria bacterium]